MLFPVLKITFRAERRFEMAYVTVPKDLTKIKSKVMFNLTKRQLICFSAAVAIGLPLFFFGKRQRWNNHSGIVHGACHAAYVFASPCTRKTGNRWK